MEKTRADLSGVAGLWPRQLPASARREATNDNHTNLFSVMRRSGTRDRKEYEYVR